MLGWWLPTTGFSRHARGMRNFTQNCFVERGFEHAKVMLWYEDPVADL